MKYKYINRLFENTLEFALKSKGAVLVVGPKSCGKTTTASLFAKTIIDLTSKENQNKYYSIAKFAPSKLLNLGPKPLMIDEWQVIPFIWNNIKYEVDKSHSFGQFILTGSVSDKGLLSEEEKTNMHTGTGRIIKKLMRTLSLYESNESNGTVSIQKLKNGEFKTSISNKNLEDYAFYICRGGWPLSINNDKKIALQQAIDFYDSLVNYDVFTFKDIGLHKNTNRAKRFLKSYSRNISTESSCQTIIKDMSANDETFNERTFDKYMETLRRLYVIEELEPWNPNLRSKTSIRSKNTRHFIDPSIAAAALKISPDLLFLDFKTFGLLFESLVIRDLRVYCDYLNAELYHYRDYLDRESDAVIEFKDGTFALVEVKLGDESEIDNAAKKLILLSKDINENNNPICLIVITATNLAYKREDGVYVIPLACLKP